MLAKIENGQIVQYPINIGELRMAYPNVSIPESGEGLESLGYVKVTQTPGPRFDPRTHRCVEQKPVLTGGVYVQSWRVEPLPEGSAAEAMRQERNRRLAACDWTQVADAPANKDAWATYRQALRDISSQPEFPFNVTWPAEPAV